MQTSVPTRERRSEFPCRRVLWTNWKNPTYSGSRSWEMLFGRTTGIPRCRRNQLCNNDQKPSISIDMDFMLFKGHPRTRHARGKPFCVHNPRPMPWNVATGAFGRCKKRCIRFGNMIISRNAWLWTWFGTCAYPLAAERSNHYTMQEQVIPMPIEKS